MADYTVLVVDDEPDLANLYAAWLETEYEVRTAHSGDAAIEQIDDSVDVVLLDRLMPDRSGDAVLAELRDGDHDCQVAMVTAVEPDFDIIEMGFDDYLVKPILRDELLAGVESLLSRADYDDGLREFYALVSKRAALLSRHDEYELADHEAYVELTERIEALNEELDATAEGFAHRDFELTLRKLSDESEDGEPADETG